MVLSYQEMEQLVWEHLAGLCRDSAWLKSYIAAALLITKEAVQVCALQGMSRAIHVAAAMLMLIRTLCVCSCAMCKLW